MEDLCTNLWEQKYEAEWSVIESLMPQHGQAPALNLTTDHFDRQDLRIIFLACATFPGHDKPRLWHILKLGLRTLTCWEPGCPVAGDYPSWSEERIAWMLADQPIPAVHLITAADHLRSINARLAAAMRHYEAYTKAVRGVA